MLTVGLCLADGMSKRPADQIGQGKASVIAHPVREIRLRRYTRQYTPQRLMSTGSSGNLHDPQVTDADHSNAPITPPLLSYPIKGILPVCSFIFQGTED